MIRKNGAASISYFSDLFIHGNHIIIISVQSNYGGLVHLKQSISVCRTTLTYSHDVADCLMDLDMKPKPITRY